MRIPVVKTSAAALVMSFCSWSAAAEEGIRLGLPIACEAHKTCFIQNYVDVDPGPGEKDFACGSATYEGHKGIDFRVLSAAAAKSGVNVIASADGIVKAIRDGMQDVFTTELSKSEVEGRECGNGVVIDHGNGWETQYCHMLKGSVSVAKKQEVKRGDKLGQVGYSGLANFAHVHLQVRRNGETLDPFRPDAAAGSCSNEANSTGLWDPAAIAPFPYRNGEIIDFGFTQAIPQRDVFEENHLAAEAVNDQSPAMIFYARFINIRANDRTRFVIDGPGGTLVEQLSAPFPKDRHRHLDYAGKKRRELPWQQGRYEARAEIVRDGAVVASAVAHLDITAKPKQP